MDNNTEVFVHDGVPLSGNGHNRFLSHPWKSGTGGRSPGKQQQSGRDRALERAQHSGARRRLRSATGAFARAGTSSAKDPALTFPCTPHNLLFVAKLRVYLAPERMPPTQHERAFFVVRYRLLYSLSVTTQAERLLLVRVLAIKI